ncbi:MAG: YegS/Rv2252/BmrU family lipid kinase [Bacteroidetes bacterium]|nr:YegS/Rv2252/BmrU family lipid kinase [Bacteroidota bacterium]
MSHFKHIAFVINPKSGVKKKQDIERLIRQNMTGKTAYDVLIWEHKHHFDEIKTKITSGSYDAVVAVGGDGTVNEVAKNLVDTPIVLGIIPRGSGNGLARSLGIPQQTADAIKRIEAGTIKTIDTGFINQHYFSCAAGVGFDAEICRLFAHSTRRGLWSYIKLSIQLLLSYKSKEYIIETDNKTIHTKAFLIAFANAGQYGNDFYVAPQAKIDDGLLHVVVVKPFGILGSFGLLLKVLMRRAHTSKNIQTITAKKITLKNTDTHFMHYDGESGTSTNGLTEVLIKPHSLHVIC